MRRSIPWPTGRAEEILQRAVLLVLSTALAGLIGLAIVAFVSSQQAAQQALDTRDQTAAAATRRIDQMRAEIADLQADLDVATAQRAELIAKVDALVAQIDALGERPVVAAGASSTTSTPRRSPSSTPAPSTTTTTRRPPPDEQPPSPPPTTTTTTTPPPRQPCLLEVPILGCATPNTARRST